ncbi:bridging integrator 3 isoform X2 [Gopherus evgoodei]|uniref:bridging integrator 3 isoform X2 n=1 Tax=Gopherus evgoodei TaxID=1825980 RepID=UPI0011CF1629|nr:bridging integrator 3 isoform X2 [Gopherus evgoodei]
MSQKELSLTLRSLDSVQDWAAQETDCTQDGGERLRKGIWETSAAGRSDQETAEGHEEEHRCRCGHVKISCENLFGPVVQSTLRARPQFPGDGNSPGHCHEENGLFQPREGVNQIQKTVIEPLKKFSSVFPSLNMAVKRREQTLQDYKRLQSKVEKYEEKEKTGPILAKLHQAREELRPVKEDFEAKNKQLLEEMPKFYSSRIDYFEPSFESLIRAQVVYYTEMHKIFGDLTKQIDEPGLTDEQREKENEAKLSELRALSIVADD